MEGFACRRDSREMRRQHPQTCVNNAIGHWADEKRALVGKSLPMPDRMCRSFQKDSTIAEHVDASRSGIADDALLCGFYHLSHLSTKIGVAGFIGGEARNDHANPRIKHLLGLDRPVTENDVGQIDDQNLRISLIGCNACKNRVERSASKRRQADNAATRPSLAKPGDQLCDPVNFSDDEDVVGSRQFAAPGATIERDIQQRPSAVRHERSEAVFDMFKIWPGEGHDAFHGAYLRARNASRSSGVPIPCMALSATS